MDTEKNMNEENSGAAEGTDTVDEVVEVKAGQNTEEPAAQEMPAAEPETPAEPAAAGADTQPEQAAAAADPGAPIDTPPGGAPGAGDGPGTPPADVKPKKTFLRACGSWTDIIPIAAMLSVLLLFFGDLVSTLLDRWVIPADHIGMALLGDPDSVDFLLQYWGFYGIWIAFILVALLFRDNRPMLKAFFYNRHGNNLKAILAGILLGFGMNGFCILMSCIRGDIKLSYSGFAPVPFFVFLFCVMIQSGAEEIIDRCYLYQKLRRRYRWPAIAVIVNALVFMALHMGNPGVTQLGLLQVFLIGVLFSLIVYYWDSLWTVIWAHTAWNFTQSIVFGLPNSGIVSKYSVFRLEAASARDGIFYNTSFGVEGSLGANVMIAALIVVVLIFGLVTKRGEKKDHWEELENNYSGRNHIWEAVVLTILLAAMIGTVIFANVWMSNHPDEVQQILENYQNALEEAGESGQAPASEQGEEAVTAEPAQEQTEGAQDAAAPLDYSDQSNWAYFGIGENKDVDLFLVCPTVDMLDEANMSLDNEVLKGSFMGALNMERGIYEDSARMFAPYYRQMAMNGYKLEDKTEQERRLQLAYKDVSDAFAYYLANENNGRPIILAGFSQGSDMVYRLMEQYFGDKEMQDRLVAVYALGWACTDEMVQKCPQIVPAQSADDLGVVISFDCEAPEVTETIVNPAGQKAHSINPLNWKTDNTPADKSENLGACFTGSKGQVKNEIAGLCGCYIDEERGALKVTDVDPKNYPAVIDIFPEGAYHVYDYQFFFRNLQENVKHRVELYMQQTAAADQAA